MYELHGKEQYFFDKATIEHLCDFLSCFKNPCCLCAPLLGKAMAENGHKITILDIDERFSQIKGFRHFDIYRPKSLDDYFDIILCDPPFFNVSLSQLFSAVRILGKNDFCQPLLISYLKRRENKILGTFAKYSLKPTGYHPSYQTIKKCEKNDIEFYSNLPEELVGKLN